MDQGSAELPAASLDPTVGILGTGLVGPEGLGLMQRPERLDFDLDVTEILKDRKSVKLMSKQDRLALLAASRAVQDAGLSSEELRDQTGIYLAVGMLPFEEQYLDQIGSLSETGGRFDIERFSREAFHSMNPLLTFKCLPNMPVFHISFNLGIHGPYFVTYPGAAQWLKALELAIRDIASGRVAYALVGAVADQRNMLVRHHFERMGSQRLDLLVDSSCVLVLASGSHPKARATLTKSSSSYRPVRPFEVRAAKPRLPVDTGPVEPALLLSLNLLESRSGSFMFSCPDGTSTDLVMELTR